MGGSRHRIPHVARVLALICLGGLVLTVGCGPPPEPPRDPDPDASNDPPPVDPAWSVHDREPLAIVTKTEDDPELQDAIEAARASADSARQNWESAEDRDSWLIKWEAPLVDGGVEYLWVRPENWTAFRVEGILTNAPRAPLEADALHGDRVSFPIEQLADWIRFTGDGTDPLAFEGGTTHRLILERHGPPPG